MPCQTVLATEENLVQIKLQKEYKHLLDFNRAYLKQCNLIALGGKLAPNVTAYHFKQQLISVTRTQIEKEKKYVDKEKNHPGTKLFFIYNVPK